MTLFDDARVVGTFLGFSEGGLEFHAELVLPYDNQYQSQAMHGQFVLVALENDNEAVLGRITTISSQGRLVSAAGEDYAIRAVREDRAIPESLRDQYLKYRVDIRILGVLRTRGGDKPPVFVASHRRLPHVGSKVAFLSDNLLRQVAGGTLESDTATEIGFMALGEFVYSGDDLRVGGDDHLEIIEPKILPRFDVNWLVSRRSFVFARAGFGKSNLVKLLFADLYGLTAPPYIEKRLGRKVPVGTVIFDPDGEYFWPDDRGQPGLCDVPNIQDRLVVFTDRQAPSSFYQSFVVDQVRLDIRELPAARVVGLVVSPDRHEHQNVQKLMALRQDKWRRLVDAVWADKNSTDLQVFYEVLQLKPETSEMEATAARSNMTRIVNAIHDPSSQLLRSLKQALTDGRLCVVDISRMRGAQGLALAGVLLQDIFEHNQEEFTKAESNSIPTIAVVEEAQSVLSSNVSHGEGPFVEWVKEGRKYDLGAMLVTQQPGSLPTELLSQGDNWFIFHLLSSGDLRVLKDANAHFSDDLLSTLLNEPLVGHGVFWSSAGEYPYPISFRSLSFRDAYKTIDPQYELEAVDNYASRLRARFRDALETAAEEVGAAMNADGSLDPVETLKRTAIHALGIDDDFHTQIRGVGVPRGRVQAILAEALPDVVGDKNNWIYRQFLVEQALDAVLGSGKWRKEQRARASDPSGSKVWWFVAEPNAQTKQDFVTSWRRDNEIEENRASIEFDPRGASDP